MKKKPNKRAGKSSGSKKVAKKKGGTKALLVPEICEKRVFRSL
jgi:hypothetical protein